MGRAKKSAEVEAQVIARGNVVPMMTETESEETVQYVSDEDAAREDRLVSEIRMITEQTKQVVLFNSIEIGRRLTEAKAMVKRGTWGTWLKERVDYSQRTANNFMKIYQEYGRNGLAEKSQALANLSYTQALALIDLPEDERARFAEERNGYIEDLGERIAKEESAGRRAELLADFNELRDCASRAANLPAIFQKYFEGIEKVIVFCPNVFELNEIEKMCPQWFSRVNGNVHTYVVHSSNPFGTSCKSSRRRLAGRLDSAS